MENHYGTKKYKITKATYPVYSDGKVGDKPLSDPTISYEIDKSEYKASTDDLLSETKTI